MAVDNYARMLSRQTASSPTFETVNTSNIKSNSATPTDLNIITGENKTLVLENCVYKDLIISALNLRGGSSPPSFSAFQNGVYAYNFTSGQVDELHGAIELQHDYNEGTDLEVHVHWSPSTTNTGNCLWKFEYSVANMGTGTFGATNTLISDSHMAGSGEINRHQYTTIGVISGVNRKIGDLIVFRVYRDAASGLDTFTGNAFLHSLGIHYCVDTIGSRTRSGK